jgi:DNA-binding NarL/FixJ family response regulator
VISVYIADALPQERLALRLVLIDLNMEIAGEAEDWSTTLAEMPIRSIDMLVAGWELLPRASNATLDELRRACPKALVIVLIGGLEVRRQAALSAGANGFISKGELPERVVEHLRAAAAKIHIKDPG